ncbi:MAG: hypothetical protein GXP48_07845 [Acidobacteria bacterium]|nr:hypothetical protein [Acidobacteriota bacterium]
MKDATRDTSSSSAIPYEPPGVRLLPAILVAAMVLTPYAAAFIPFQRGLVAQLAVLLMLMAIAAWDGSKQPAPLLSNVPMPVVIGLGLYAAAALWGAGIGFLSENPARFVASQTIALLLLPAGAWAFLRTRGHGAESIGNGLAMAALIACLIHVSVIATPVLRQVLMREGLRFVFRNDADAMGAVVLLLVILAARWAHRKTLGNGLAAGAAALLLVGSQTRGAWITATVGLGVVTALFARSFKRLVTGLVIVGLCGALLVGLAGWAIMRGPASKATLVYSFDPALQGGRGNFPRPDQARIRDGSPVFVPSPRKGADLVLVRNLPVAAPVLKLDVKARVPRGQVAVAWLEVVDKSGQKLHTQYVSLNGTGRDTSYSRIFVIPAHAKSIALGVEAGRGIHATAVSSVRLEVYSSLATAWLHQVTDRAFRPLRSLTGGPEDPNLAYRGRELEAIWTQWRRTSAVRLVTGQGLGATFPFVNSGWDSHGRRTQLKRASYIHNYYVMLAFKLGLAGIVALAGLLAVVVWTFRRAIRCRTANRWLLVGATAAWTAYLLWSVTSPEIYDFRMAPIWGALVAACVRAETAELQPAALVPDVQQSAAQPGDV